MYKQAYLTFATDYDKENPATAKEGMLRWVNAKREELEERYEAELVGLDPIQRATRLR